MIISYSPARRRTYQKQTPGTVRMIRRLDRGGFPREQIARAFRTCQSNISYIARRVTWRDIK